MSEMGDILDAAAGLAARGEPMGLATVVSVRGSSYRRPGARLLVPATGRPIGLISGGCLEEEAARLARQAIEMDAPVLVRIDHSAEGDELWGSGLGCRGVIELLAEPPSLAAGTLAALRAARDEGRATYHLTSLDGSRRKLAAAEAVSLGERSARAVLHGRPTVIGDAVLDPILPPLHLVVCGAGPDAAPLVAAGLRQGWRVDVVDPRRSFLREDRFLGARLLDSQPQEAADATAAGEWTAAVVMSHDFHRDAAFLGGFLGHRVPYLGVLGPRDRTDRLLAELPAPPREADVAALHAPAGLDIGADGSEQVATAIVAEILAVLHGRSGGPLRSQPGPIHGPRAESAPVVVPDQVRATAAAIEGAVPADAIVAIYLYGSALVGGLRPDSDLDFAVVTARRLTAAEKGRLFDAIRPLSRRSLRPDDWRPLEVTVLALPDVRPWRYPPQVDAQYGEWLSDTELSDQVRRGPAASPDLAVLVTMLRQASHPYRGPAAADVLAPVPFDDLGRATLDAIPSLLDDLEDDTRNVLLTLARMWATMLTKELHSKGDAAAWAADRLPADARGLMDDARTLYENGGWGEWAAVMADARRLARLIVDEIRLSRR